jgi:branched-chain amino acid transport system permease protein
MTFFLQLVVTGFALGMVYALVAIGFVIILKCSEAFNIAQGHFVLIGGYLGYTFLVPFGLPVWASLLMAIGVAIVMGLLIERLTLRPLVGQPVLAVIMMTIALASVLEGLATLLWGGEYKTYHGLLPTLSLKLGEISIPSESLIGLIVSVGAVVILMLFFRYKGDHRLCRLMGHRLCRWCHRRHSLGGRIWRYDPPG